MADSSSSSSSTLRNWHPLEYAHVLLWLLKDTCWAMHWTTFGSIMVVPTVLAAYVITWIQRKRAVVLIHNLAISFWISANSLWMLAEFYELEPMLKPFAMVGFGIGLTILLAWYVMKGFGFTLRKPPLTNEPTTH